MLWDTDAEHPESSKTDPIQWLQFIVSYKGELITQTLLGVFKAEQVPLKIIEECEIVE